MEVNKHILLTATLFLFFLPALAGQPAVNPFELIPRLEGEQAEQAVDAITQTRGTGNPFDLITPSGEPVAADSPRGRINREERYQRFQFTLTLLLLIALAILLSLFRGYFQRAFRAFLNDNMLGQAKRDQESGRALPFYLFYTFFILNAGWYLYLLAQYYGHTFPGSPFRVYLLFSLGVGGLLLLKHLTLSLIGSIFPVGKETSLYNFMIVIFGVILGGVLFAANLLIAYAAPGQLFLFIFLSYILLALFYLFRALRGLFIGNRFLALHKFHFLLYICTVEIAPVLVLIKLISRQL